MSSLISEEFICPNTGKECRYATYCEMGTTAVTGGEVTPRVRDELFAQLPSAETDTRFCSNNAIVELLRLASSDVHIVTQERAGRLARAVTRNQMSFDRTQL